MPQLPPGGTAFDGGDPVLWAKLVPGGQEHADSHADGRHSYREAWLVRTSAPNLSPAVVRASKRIPAEGFVYYQHAPATDPLLVGTYMRDVNEADALIVRDADAVVVLREFRQTGDPYYWEVTVHYEGTDDPTAEPPEFAVEEVAYQEFLTFDVNGKPVMNSALDPIDGGMPSEGFYKRVTVTRNLPYTSWHSKKGDPYRKTLNRAAFVYSGQTDGGPVTEEAGAVLLDSIREQRVLKRRGVGTANEWYWRVTAELLVDLQTVRLGGKVTLPDGSELAPGSRVKRLHRWVVPDAGFHAFKDDGTGRMKKQLIRTDPAGSSHPQLLDGRGETLIPRATTLDPIAFNAFVRTSALGGLCPDFYATDTATAITVSAANGVLANDTDPTVTSVVKVDDPAHHDGTFTLSADGSFTYDPVDGFVGWDRFTYKPTGALDATKQTVQIFVGAVPVLLFFDRYRFSNWADIAVLLEGW